MRMRFRSLETTGDRFLLYELFSKQTPPYCGVTVILVYHCCASNLESKSQDEENQEVNWLSSLEICNKKFRTGGQHCA